MTMHEELQRCFPVRKTKKQKEAFRTWFLEKAKAMGYQARVEASDGLGWNKNVVAGDAENAQVIISAHYDTPANMPIPNFITPRNIGVYLLYQAAVVIPMLLLVFGVEELCRHLGMDFQSAYWVGLAMLWAIIFLMMAGPANPNNANDNTSGVAAVLQLMEQLPQDMRHKAAFVLFDNEEKGMLGSRAYAGEHKRIKKEKLLINLDCVGVGEDILFFVPKETRALPAYERLQQSMQTQTCKTVHFFPLEKSMYPSDQANFRHGVAVCACRKNKRVGFYCSRIHTKGDTLCEQSCLDALTEGLKHFIVSDCSSAKE